ncbi:MAG: SLBB domain-containing protein [Synechococcales bacterium]|nr:SLBB domain-containing protein [Synechococcales bacterium]
MAQTPSLAQEAFDNRPGINPGPVTTDLGAPAPAYEDLYTLGGGDRVYMNVFNLPDYSREYDVLADGTVNLPLIGTVYAEGKTLAELATEVETLYGRYIRVPSVTFDLQRARSLQVAIAGEVRRPGSYPLVIDPQPREGASSPTVPTVTWAIQTAGGITETANIRDIQVYRPNPQNPTQGEWIQVDLWQLIQAGDLSQDLPLRDGDSIVVPEATELSPGDALTIATANFSPDTINIYVAGQVNNPGLIELTPNTTLNQALLAAGGPTAEASRRVTLVRLNPNGSVTERRIRVDYDEGVNDETNPALRNNDAILVGRSTLSRVTDTIGTAFSPFASFLNVFRIVDIIDEITEDDDPEVDNDDDEEDRRDERRGNDEQGAE